jgi:hypothetical protein
MPSALNRASKVCNSRGVSFRRDPTLAELLSDPIVKAIMKADGVSRRELEALIKKVVTQRMVDKLMRTPPRGAKAH